MAKTKSGHGRGTGIPSPVLRARPCKMAGAAGWLMTGPAGGRTGHVPTVFRATGSLVLRSGGAFRWRKESRPA